MNVWQRKTAIQQPKEKLWASDGQVSTYGIHPARGKKAKGVRIGLPCERQCIKEFVVQGVVPNVVEDPTTCLFISIHITVAPPSNFNLSNLT